MTNIFRLLGDLTHLLAITILLQKIWDTRSCAGISGKSQILFTLVYTTRYLDLITTYVSLYNTSLKLVFLGSSYTTLYLIYHKFRATYDKNHDTFRIEFLILPSALLAFLINHQFSSLEILWTFSIYLESVAILPQLFMVSKTGEAQRIIHYLFAMGCYRGLYILNWIYRYWTEGHSDPIAIVAGVVQTMLYCVFFLADDSIYQEVRLEFSKGYRGISECMKYDETDKFIKTLEYPVTHQSVVNGTLLDSQKLMPTIGRPFPRNPVQTFLVKSNNTEDETNLEFCDWHEKMDKKNETLKSKLLSQMGVKPPSTVSDCIKISNSDDDVKVKIDLDQEPRIKILPELQRSSFVDITPVHLPNARIDVVKPPVKSPPQL